MNWLTWIVKALQLAPAVVMGVEAITKETQTPGVTKKQMAMDALGLSSAVAGAVAPQYKAQIDAATQLASSVIDGVVATLNAIGHPLFAKTPSAPPAAAAAGQ